MWLHAEIRAIPDVVNSGAIAALERGQRVQSFEILAKRDVREQVGAIDRAVYLDEVGGKLAHQYIVDGRAARISRLPGWATSQNAFDRK